MYYVYIMANKHNSVIYVGVTNNIQTRVTQHRNGKEHGFTWKYKITKLVYVETTTDVMAAITREKEIKAWRREKKNNLIESLNPNWDDLLPE